MRDVLFQDTIFLFILPYDHAAIIIPIEMAQNASLQIVTSPGTSSGPFAPNPLIAVYVHGHERYSAYSPLHLRNSEE